MSNAAERRAARRRSPEAKALDAGVELLKPLLTSVGFSYRSGDSAESSGGPFANGYFIRDTIEIGLIVRDHSSLTTRAGSLNQATSTGQRQVTSLVFIASLVALAKKRDKITSILRGLAGSEYPIVMDSPFGSLSTRFRKGVSRWIPSLAPQVLAMVSWEQFKGAVDETFSAENRIGRRYHLQVHGPALDRVEQETITIKGIQYQQYFDAPEKKTVIVEIEE